MNTCEDCDKTIVEEEILDAHHDDSGSYHYECYEELSKKEADFWAGQYYETPAPASATGGYDWGDPKNPEYVEYVLDNADTIR